MYGPIELKQIFRIVSPTLGGNKILRLKNVEIKYKSDYKMLTRNLEFAKYFLKLKICISSRLKIDWNLTRKLSIKIALLKWLESF